VAEQSETPGPLTHLNEQGQARMVDVSAKSATLRQAGAVAFVSMPEAVVKAVREGGLPKGDAFAVAKVAGIMAAKKTADLIPLCHSLALSDVNVELKIAEGGVSIASEATTTGPTGVEMEALTAAAVAALTVYDMCKAVDRSIRIEKIELVRKSGGRSGDWRRAGSL